MSILVILEQRAKATQSWETLAAGQQLAAQMGMTLQAAVMGSDGIASCGGGKEAIKVWSVKHALLAYYTADGFTAACEQLIKKAKAAVVLFPHTYQVRDFAPKLATRFSQVFISDVISVRPERRFVEAASFESIRRTIRR